MYLRKKNISMHTLHTLKHPAVLPVPSISYFPTPSYRNFLLPSLVLLPTLIPVNKWLSFAHF